MARRYWATSVAFDTFLVLACYSSYAACCYLLLELRCEALLADGGGLFGVKVICDGFSGRF